MDKTQDLPIKELDQLDELGAQILAECQEAYSNHTQGYDDKVCQKEQTISQPYFLLSEIKSVFGNKVFDYLVRGRN